MDGSLRKGKKFIHEFREFAVKGNVVDLAIGVIIGGAFGKIVSSLVNDLLMPFLGVLLGGVDFKNLSVTLKEVSIGGAGEIIPAITINYGLFIQTIVDFVIMAGVIFIAIKLITRMRRTDAKKEEAAPVKTNEEKLLEEIRDLLKARRE